MKKNLSRRSGNKKHSTSINSISVILVALLGCAFIAVSFLIAKIQGNSQKSLSQQSAQPSSQTADLNISSAGEYVYYRNPTIGIEVKYPKHSTHQAGLGCTEESGQITATTGVAPLQIFEDMANDSLYISFPSTAVLTHKQIRPGVYRGFSNCRVEPLTLEILRKGIDTGWVIPYDPQKTHIMYRTITSEDDLVVLAQNYFGTKRCKQTTQTLVDASQELYKVEIATEYVGDTPIPESEIACHLPVYEFIYSKKHQLAVIWSLGHEPPWQLNNQSRAISVSFLDR